MIYRNITPSILSALSDSPVVLLNGARQSGKSTLIRLLAEQKRKTQYCTLDDVTTLAAATQDPKGFLEGFTGPVAIDEIQRVPELFLALKADVDRKRVPGKYLLTGSANILFLPHAAEYLVGRMEILTLWPLAQREIEKMPGSFVDSLFAPSLKFESVVTGTRKQLFARMLRGGYPEINSRTNRERQEAWFRSYLTTIIQREIRDLANIEGLNLLPRLLSLLATRTGGLINIADIASSIGLPQTTMKRYMSLLEAAFLIQPLPAWSVNLSKRLIKTPKLYLTDTGLLAHLLEIDETGMTGDGSRLGQMMENFVIMEIIKQIQWSKIKPAAFYLRTASGNEVDVVLERRDGSIVGIEIKSATSVSGEDFKGLRFLANEIGKRFVRGIVFYTGKEIVSFGNKNFAVPVDCLWMG